MPLTNYPQGASSFGMPILPVAMGMGTVGNVFWVNSQTGTDANGRGTDPSRPFKTLNYALTKCNAPSTNPGKPGGDFVMLMPGHLESISVAGGAASPTGSVSFNVAGVTVIGLGSGSQRPTLQWTATAGQVAILANNVTIYNVFFDMCSQINAVVSAISVSGTRVSFKNCEFLRENAANNALIAIALAAGWANFTLEDCVSDAVAGGSAGATQFLSIAAGDNLVLRRCRITGQYSTATINSGAAVVTNLFAEWCVFDNQAANKPVIGVAANSTGRLNECYWTGNGWLAVGVAASSPIVNGGNLLFRQCFGVSTVAKNGVLSPAAAGTI